jgi:hypothetical protein
MFTSQQEGRAAVIKRGWSPAVDGMAAIALCAEFASVRVILRVTGGAVHWSTFEHTILVAILADNTSVFSIKVEGEGRMIHSRQIPAFRTVTSGAICAELTIVPITLCMAGETILRGGFQVVEITRVDMALRTQNLSVFTNQIKRNQIMVKGGSV